MQKGHLALLSILLLGLLLVPHTYASYNLNFSIDSDSLPPALQDIIKSIAGIQRIYVSGTFTGTDSKHWFFSGTLTVETTHGTAFSGSLHIRYSNGVVDWGLKFGSGIKIKIWSLGTKRFDVALKKIPFIKHIDIGADVYLEMGGTGGLTNGVGQADVYIGLSAHAVLGFFKDKAIRADANIDANIDGKIHLVISYDGKYVRVGWYPEVGARAVFRFGKWISWNWGDRWIPEKRPWPIGEWDVSSSTVPSAFSATRSYADYEDVPVVVYNSSDGGGSENIELSDAPNYLHGARDMGNLVAGSEDDLVVYPIYGSASVSGSFVSGDKDYYKVGFEGVDSDLVLYLLSEGADYDLYVYTPSGQLVGSSENGGEGLDAVVVSRSVLEANDNSLVVEVRHFSGDGAYVLTAGYVGLDNSVYEPPCTVIGSLTWDGSNGPHYNNPFSSSWGEVRVNLEEGNVYRASLVWSDNSSDLDLYVYAPGKAPSLDGSGSDYYDSSVTLNSTEYLEFEASESGEWVFGIDFYSGSGSVNYTLSIEIVSSSSGSQNDTVFSPPITIEGTIEGSSLGPHYNDPDSISWVEYRVDLDEGVNYTVSLYWNGTSDLDLYVYAPGTAPSEDGGGSDYYIYSATTDVPEVIHFVPNVSGTWVIAIDHYSEEGEANYKLFVGVESGGSEANNILRGTVSYDGSGSHYNSPDSPAWSEHRVVLEEGVTYIITLRWDSYADLDLYVYAPGTAPSEDGTGSDYKYRAYTSNNPETLRVFVDVGGEWIIAVDKYSGSGDTQYEIEIVRADATQGVTELRGSVRGTGSVGPHFEGDSWSEHKIYLEAGTTYKIVLSWGGTSDLDLYVYAPGTAPSEDGTGSDYKYRAYTSNRPEVIIFTPDTSGLWVIGVDHYSKSGSASYEIVVSAVNNVRASQYLEGSISKDVYVSKIDSDGDGLSDNMEGIPFLTDPNNPLLPAIYPPLLLLLALVVLFKRKILLRKN